MGLDHPAPEALELPAVLHALSDPQRLSIVRKLAAAEGPRRCGSFDLAVTKSTLTHHFRVLREAGLIEQREDGTARLNSLRRADLDDRFPGLIDAVLRPASPAPARPAPTPARPAPAPARPGRTLARASPTPTPVPAAPAPAPARLA
ncbi:MAG TPA: helix-turn-helix domain-containing protein [Solirubrobacteraceae bacterium]|jgi:DNA-binding transcriptional ArsR family regulator|nr:helix-turn-helix domain-containing protein [Solirubrobacteraceae bacterium]